MTNILYNPCHPSVTGAVSSINIPHTSKDTEHSSLKTRNRRRMKSGAVSGHFEPRQDVADVASPKRGGPGAESPGKGGGVALGTSRRYTECMGVPQYLCHRSMALVTMASVFSWGIWKGKPKRLVCDWLAGLPPTPTPSPHGGPT